MKRISCLLGVLALLATAPLTRAVESTEGDYTPMGSPYYRIVNHQLCCYSGGVWYVLRAPQFDGGFILNVRVGSPERWCRVGGSHLVSYQRTGASFRDASRPPVMAINVP